MKQIFRIILIYFIAQNISSAQQKVTAKNYEVQPGRMDGFTLNSGTPFIDWQICPDSICFHLFTRQGELVGFSESTDFIIDDALINKKLEEGIYIYVVFGYYNGKQENIQGQEH